MHNLTDHEIESLRVAAKALHRIAANEQDNRYVKLNAATAYSGIDIILERLTKATEAKAG